MKHVTIQTPCGLLTGIEENGVCNFRGIRYATADRFAYPEEVTNWEGTYEALTFGAAPIQTRAYIDGITYFEKPFSHREFMDGVKSDYSEDCLFLNIWAPKDADGCPVLICIYGGGLVNGQSNETTFDGTEFAKRGIILVTLNYRVNIFGFCALEALKDSQGRCGNYGYYDQQMAFQWIQHNIRAFGGDPQNMGLIGQSAGAASVETQIKSPLNKGIFKSAIIQSSAGFSTIIKAKDNRQEIYALWQKVYESSGCQSIEEFRNMPTKELFDTWYAIAKDNMLKYATAIYDENFTSTLKNQPCPTHIICGLTAQDTMPILFYILCKALGKSQLGNGRTYMYYFCRQLPGDDWGAWHSSDLRYTYGTLDKSWRPFGEEDAVLSSEMMDYYAQFIKTGDPNHSGATQWPCFTKKEKRFMFFDVGGCKMGRPRLTTLLKDTLFYKGPRM